MSNQLPQSYSNYKRNHPPFHFLVLPVLIMNVIVAIVYLVRHPSPLTGWLVLLSITLVVLAFLVRINPLKVQDRLIRLEEQLRLTALLPAPLRARISELSERQLVALRFAPDVEIPPLVTEILSYNLSPKDIKKKIQNWRPDNFRV
jgi:hypothetical protein